MTDTAGVGSPDVLAQITELMAEAGRLQQAGLRRSGTFGTFTQLVARIEALLGGQVGAGNKEQTQTQATEWVELNEATDTVTVKLAPAPMAVTIPLHLAARVFAGTDARPAGLFAPALRWVHPAGSAFAIERRPCTVDVFASDHNATSAARAQDHRLYHLALPWLIYIISFTDATVTQLRGVQIFVRPGPLMALTDPLYAFPFPNVQPGSGACLGNLGFSRQSELTTAQVCDSIINTFWGSHFNSDTPTWPGYLPPELAAVLKADFNGEAGRLLAAWEGFEMPAVLDWSWKTNPHYPDLASIERHAAVASGTLGVFTHRLSRQP